MLISLKKEKENAKSLKCLSYSVAAQPREKEEVEICPMCRRPKREHTQQELESCQRKMREFKESKTGGAGVQ